jgi:alpha-D-xyloside xylohydrolase
MLMKKYTYALHCLLIAFLYLTAVSCSQKNSYEKESNGIVISLDKKKIRLQVFSKDIIRVTVTPNDSFSTEKSLMAIDPKQTFTDWTVEEKPGQISLHTPGLVAEVSVPGGEIVFKDSAGNTLLEEKKGGGKTFTPVTVEGKPYFNIRQVFESPANEAFYGLGQHQFGYMNYKGKDVELAQHNMDVAVPFIYSNKNYGILWDNYSVTRFGDPRAYEPITSLNLFTKEGEEGGLTTTYFFKDKTSKTAKENNIDYAFLETKNFERMPKNLEKITWEGSFASDKEGKHKFLLYASEYFKLWIDDSLIMDKWRQNWNPWFNPFEVDLTKGAKHSIKIEWIPNGGYIGMTHLNPQEVAEQNRLSMFSEIANEIDYYFIKGNNADEVISGYRTVTGKAPIVPKWAMGFWQSRERYPRQDTILNVVKAFRKRKIPLDNIVLDWFYWPENKWGSHEFDTIRFPDAKNMVSELHNNLHANIMISVWPKFYTGIDHYKEMEEKGYLYKRNVEKKRKDWVGPGYLSTFYDAFNPGARKLFWDQMNEHLNSKGFDAWWLDASEPDMQSNISLEERKLTMSPTALGPGAKYFNAFPLMNAKGIYEEQRMTNPDKRVFILTRSAYAGQQRFGASTWSGDIASRWSDMKDQISAGVNFSLSGLPYWTMDIGGFALENRYGAYGDKPTKENLDEWRELNTRWYQFGAFCPIFRVHGQFPYREVFNIAPENHPAYQSMLYYDKLRYRLMPYFYTLAGKAYHDDYTLMRGLVMDFGKDKNVLNINDQFMAGPSLLINPVCEYKARERQVYLPSTTNWYDLYTGKYYEGGRALNVKAALGTIPVFVKEGSILPVGPEIQYTNEKPDSNLTLYIYAGKNVNFDLYEDESINYNYEHGAFTVTPLSYDEKTGMLSIGKRKGSFEGMLKERTFRIVYVDKNTAVAFNPKMQTTSMLRYNGEPIHIQLRK